MTNPPADWYPDPSQANRLRYWDGMQWTSHVVDAPAPAPRQPAPAEGAGATAYPDSSQPRTTTTAAGRGKPRSRKRKWVAGGLAALFAIGLLDSAFGEDDPAPTRGSSGATTTSEPVAPTSTATDAPSATPAEKTTSASPTSSAGPTMYLVTSVIDGDTIKVRISGTSYRVRILGIDTPELSTQECQARDAASRMQSLVQSKAVTLERDPKQPDKDKYGRLIRHVVLTDGRYAAQALLERGLAREYLPSGTYAMRESFQAAERAAKKRKLGIWSAACAPAPRAPLVRPTAPKPTSPATCDIKGNIASDGEKIYHVPGQSFYDRTVITLSKGERWFCSETEAVAAGWRRAKV